MPDEFSPNGNPQDRFTTVDPMKYLPAGFTPVFSDAADAQATLDAVTADINAAAQSGQMNQVLDIALGVLGTVLGAPAKALIP